jgi:hypothetical protein
LQDGSGGLNAIQVGAKSHFQFFYAWGINSRSDEVGIIVK